MIKPHRLSRHFLFGLIVLQNHPVRMFGRSTQCSPAAIQKCSNEHRLCDHFEDGREECGQCQLGYIHFMNSDEMNSQTTSFSCVEISEITFDWFVTMYDPSYSFVEDGNPTRRLALLKESAQLITESNTPDRNLPYTLGFTPFSADTEVEYQQRAGYFYVNLSGTSDELASFDPPTVAAADIPMNIDWVATGAVTPVKDQGRCACSWAIGVCGAIEGAAYQSHGSNESMSFQQLVSCNKRNLGCDGGSTTIGARYAADNWFGGITALENYPYTDGDGLTSNFCNLTAATPAPSVKVSDPVSVTGLGTMISFEKRLETFKLALMKKPISIILKSSCKIFSNYISGILTDDGECACSDSSCYDHSVLMVGFDDTDEIPYFKFKNSWGTRWGEDGYFRVAQSQKGTYGLFGIFGEGVMVDAARNEAVALKDIGVGDSTELAFGVSPAVVNRLQAAVCNLSKDPVNFDWVTGDKILCTVLKNLKNCMRVAGLGSTQLIDDLYKIFKPDFSFTDGVMDGCLHFNEGRGYVVWSVDETVEGLEVNSARKNPNLV